MNLQVADVSLAFQFTFVSAFLFQLWSWSLWKHIFKRGPIIKKKSLYIDFEHYVFTVCLGQHNHPVMVKINPLYLLFSNSEAASFDCVIAARWRLS